MYNTHFPNETEAQGGGVLSSPARTWVWVLKLYIRDLPYEDTEDHYIK